MSDTGGTPPTGIDNILSNTTMSWRADVFHTGFSDHTAQAVSLDITGYNIPIDVTFREFSGSAVESFCMALADETFEGVYMELGADSKYSTFANTFLLHFNSHFIKKSKKVSKYNAKYVRNDDLTQCKRELVAIQELLNSYPEFKDMYTTKQKEYNILLINNKNTEIEQALMNEKNHSKYLWQVISENINKGKETTNYF